SPSPQPVGTPCLLDAFERALSRGQDDGARVEPGVASGLDHPILAVGNSTLRELQILYLSRADGVLKGPATSEELLIPHVVQAEEGHEHSASRPKNAVALAQVVPNVVFK